MDFSETIIVYDIKVGRCSKLNEYVKLYEYQRQGHSMTSVQGHSDSTFSNFFFLETARSTEAKLYLEPPWDAGTKVCSNGLGRMTKMAAMPIYGKNLNFFSSGTKRPMTLKVGMQHWVLEYY